MRKVLALHPRKLFEVRFFDSEMDAARAAFSATASRHKFSHVLPLLL
jgi:hypothetical protein